MASEQHAETWHQFVADVRDIAELDCERWGALRELRTGGETAGGHGDA